MNEKNGERGSIVGKRRHGGKSFLSPPPRGTPRGRYDGSMQPHNALLWWWLGILDFRRYELLQQYFGDLDTAIEELSPEVLRGLKLRPDTADRVLARREAFDPHRYQQEMDRRGVRLVSIEDEEYPPLLREIGDPPVFLSGRGDWSLLCRPLIALVGTRAMTSYGRRVVEAFVPPLARAGFVTVSGLALGIDAAVARQSLAHDGPTIAVLGNGLGSVYPPENRDLADDILQAGGLLISEFPLEAVPGKYTFPSRNRIIAGLCPGTVVCEAPAQSGAVITAELALEYGREVFAVPGVIFDEMRAGCHALIAKGEARLVSSAADLLRELGAAPAAEQPVLYAPTDPHEKLLYAVLSALPQSLDDLAEQTDLDAAQIGVALTMMELAGGARNVGGGQWVRS